LRAARANHFVVRMKSASAPKNGYR